jgi:hypothetical protein
MGNLKHLLGGAIATVGLVSIAAAHAEVVTVMARAGHDHFSIGTSVDRAKDPNPGGVAPASFARNGPIEWVKNDPNRAGAHGIDGDETNRPPSDRILGVELPEVPTWVMIALGFAGLGFAAFRSPRKPRDLFS